MTDYKICWKCDQLFFCSCGTDSSATIGPSRKELRSAYFAEKRHSEVLQKRIQRVQKILNGDFDHVINIYRLLEANPSSNERL